MIAITVRPQPIVKYTGRLVEAHGYWRVADTGARLTLVNAAGDTLEGVHHGNVTVVPLPPLTEARADALRSLTDPHGQAPARHRRWLIANDLARIDPAGRTALTAIGRELAAALPARRPDWQHSAYVLEF